MTIPERLAVMEERQKAHEKENETALFLMSQEISEVRSEVKAIAPVLAGINDSLAALAADKTARDAVAGDRRSRKMDFRDWLIALGGVATIAGIVLEAIK